MDGWMDGLSLGQGALHRGTKEEPELDPVDCNSPRQLESSIGEVPPLPLHTPLDHDFIETLPSFNFALTHLAPPLDSPTTAVRQSCQEQGLLQTVPGQVPSQAR